MKRLSILWIAVLVTAGIVIAGCGSSSSSSSSSSGETEAESGGSAIVSEAEAATKEAEAVPTEIPSASLGPVTPKAGGTVYHVACDLSLPGCANQAKGVKSAAAAIGFKYEQCDGGSSPDTIAECFTNAVNAKPDVIIPNGLGVDTAGEGYAAAAKAGIPIVGMFTGNPPGTEGVVTEVAGETCLQQGKANADWVIADSGGTANAVFIGTQTYKCNQQRLSSFEKEIEKCSGCTSSNLIFSIASLGSTLPQQIQAELQSNPDVTYMVGTFDAVALAAADAIRQAGKTEEIKVAGFDGDAPNLELIRNGEIQQVDITSGTTEPGWAAVDAAARVINGEEVPPVTNVSTVLASAANVEELGEAYLGATGFEKQFEELWGK
jgi:ribose transport system substrate-binding protein